MASVLSSARISFRPVRRFEALQPLKRVEWSLHKEPWRHLLLVNMPDQQRGNSSWTMRNEGRKQAIDTAREVLEFIVGVTTLNEESQDNLRQRWTNALVPVPEEAESRTMWASCACSGNLGTVILS